MEFPSFVNHHHHHHHRYVPPPPPHNNFPEDRPNFYPHHHHHHHIPSVNLIPSPHSYAPHVHPPPPPPLHVPPPPPPPPSYNPNFTYLDAQQHNRSPPRVSNHSYRFDYRTSSRSDPNMLPLELPHANPIATEDHHRRFYSPNPQSDSYYNSHGSESLIPSSRFIDDTINDGYAIRGISDVLPEQQVFRGSSSNVDRYASAGSSSRILEDYDEKYEKRYMPMPENERIWNHHLEDPKWVMKGKQNELGYNDGTSFVTGRDQSRDDHEFSKFDRFREGREEFKQVQKKSVLLRIGKPNDTHRNRNHDQHSSKGYSVELNNSNYRGKEKLKDRDRDHTGKDQRIEGDKEHGHVDLDVSFKSNALVAKPVVAPSSPVSDNNHAQTRNRKIKRFTDFGSPLSKISERSTRSRSSSHGFDSPSSSEKAPKRPTDKDSIYGENSSLSGPVLDQADGNGGSKLPLSFRLKKKRKLMNLGSSSFNFQLAVKDNKNVQSEKSDNIPVTPTPEEVIASKVDESSPAIVLEKDGSEAEDMNLHHINGSGDACTENKNLNAENASLNNDDLANDLNRQLCENEIPLNLENDTRNMSTDVKLSLGGTDISATSEHDQIEVQNWSTESPAGLDVANVSDDLGNESVKVQEISTITDVDSVDSRSDEIVIVSFDNSDDQGFHGGLSKKEDESQLFEGTSNRITFNGSGEHSENDTKESTHTVIIVEDNAAQGNSHKEHSFDKDAITEMENPISTSVQIPRADHKEPRTDSKDDLPPSLSTVSTFADAGVSVTDVTNSDGKLGESRPDILTGGLLPEKVSDFSHLHMMTNKLTDKTISSLTLPENDENSYLKSVSKDVAIVDAPNAGIKTSHLEVTNEVSSASQGGSVKTLDSNTTMMQRSILPLKKSSTVPAVPRVFAARSSPVFTNSRTNKAANSITKPRTWHRSSSNPAPAPLPPKQIATSQNSYVRSGNSLVRKVAPVNAIALRPSVYQLNPPGPIEARNAAGSGNKVNNTYSRVAGSSALVVRPKTPPLSGTTKLPDCPTSSRDLSFSQLEPLPASPVEENSVLQKVSEDQICTSNKSESQKVVEEVVTGNKVQYVKRKSNQLVAASCSDQSIKNLDTAQASSSSDSYYKRIKNQLIRTSVGDESANTDKDKASKNSIKRQFGKGTSKKYKHARFPSVWTLNSQSLGKDGVSLRQKLRPQLFPWKRSRNWANLTNISALLPCDSSSSFISRKLLLSRKRDTIYTRSKHGFSLRMSKLLSVGGASLKWSKSIERNSRKTNEEATLAVAAAEKRKREQKGTAEVKSRNNTSRERIFRIGLVRYKMDPSRRTLQRISDEELTNSTQSKEVIRKSYVPKRLKIGHDEYVRIGNGNQLVRNPKRRTRVFANEKVRWSLHTARSRLAKKKFCQFFTRFGKCNKDDGKCPYIHDSSKIAVCTKFLNGSCFNPNCKLTHKVIPERMQDCSYFLQGLCSNKNCPYRHVNVNSSASVCEGFLKGYCADGNECRKKHSYACAIFEATGVCPQGTKCKLHHPKNQLKRKRQNLTEHHQKNSRGRYFGSISSEEVAIPISEKQCLKYDDLDDDDVDGGIFCQDGKLAEFISLDFGNEDGEVTSGQYTRLISEPLGLLGADEFDDELTKPVGIMKR